ncbi:hypothetical protein [Cytobacillus oceanisediminis]|uniref:hypothetical protein n=1 Tax=Cytobacillus oceanisediminis TaxID=665099 RepID=UPI00373568F3
MKKVTVQFVFDGVIRPQENLQGVLFGDKVLIAGGEVGLYQAVKTDNPDEVIVDLVANDTDYLSENPALLIELIVSDLGGGSFVQV